VCRGESGFFERTKKKEKIRGDLVTPRRHVRNVVGRGCTLSPAALVAAAEGDDVALLERQL
jgi:hypothetical protein